MIGGAIALWFLWVVAKALYPLMRRAWSTFWRVFTPRRRFMAGLFACAVVTLGWAITSGILALMYLFRLMAPIEQPSERGA